MPEYSEEDLAAHQDAINRALGLGLETESPPDGQEQLEFIEIEDTTEEDSSQSETEEPPSSSQASSPTESYRLELTIDLTDSPPVSQQVAHPASPVASQSLAQPSKPASPAMQCPVCLETFSAIRSRGEHCLVWSFISSLSPPFRVTAGQHGVWSRLLPAVSPPVCPHSAAVSNLQEEDRSPGLSPTLPLNYQKANHHRNVIPSLKVTE